MQMTLTRKQELYLIDLGLRALLDQTVPTASNGHRSQKNVEKADYAEKKLKKDKRPAWTPERRAKFAATMQKTWAKKRKAQKAAEKGAQQ